MKVISAQAAAGLLKDGWTVAATGFGGFGHPEAVTAAIEARFLEEQHPRDVTLLFAASSGDRKARGMSHFGNEGMVKRVIAAGWRGSPRLGALAVENKIEGYIWPQGVISQLFRATAAGQPGLLSAIGLHTFVDPRHGGGRLNARTSEPLVEIHAVRGREWLFYPAQPVHCAIVRGTTADEDGNVTSEDEAFHQDMLAIAQAARNSGGIVIVQVKRIAKSGSLNPNLVRIPGMLVDYVVVSAPEQHGVSFGEQDNPAYTGAFRDADPSWPSMPLDASKVMQRRAFLELRDHADTVINLGMGIPAGIGNIAHEEGKSDITLTLESGVIGGIPAAELSFGAATNPVAIIDQASQFDFYDGGGLDFAFLGMAQMDVHGNVNVSRFGKQVVGVGGFINIAQSARRLAFLGSLTTGGADVRVEGGKLAIVREGTIRKVLDDVEHLSFSGVHAASQGREVLYITERAVFALREGGLTLVEIAPGVDLEKDVRALIPAGVRIAAEVRTMDARIFSDGPMSGAAKARTP
jgi:propionate CoA-transferase